MNFQKRTIQYDITLEEVQRHYKAIHDAEVCMVDRLLKISLHSSWSGKRKENGVTLFESLGMAINLKTLTFFFTKGLSLVFFITIMFLLSDCTVASFLVSDCFL